MFNSELGEVSVWAPTEGKDGVQSPKRQKKKKKKFSGVLNFLTRVGKAQFCHLKV